MKSVGVFCLLLGLSGCGFCKYAVRNIVSAPVDAFEECSFRCRLRRLARTQWAEACKAEARSYSTTYVQGFEDGFVEYIDRNGNGDPPAMPPQCLQRGVLRGPQGQEIIKDWFDGYKHGASVAQSTGLRDRVLVPVSLPPRITEGSLAPSTVAPGRTVLDPLEETPPPAKVSGS